MREWRYAFAGVLCGALVMIVAILALRALSAIDAYAQEARLGSERGSAATSSSFDTGQ